MDMEPKLYENLPRYHRANRQKASIQSMHFPWRSSPGRNATSGEKGEGVNQPSCQNVTPTLLTNNNTEEITHCSQDGSCQGNGMESQGDCTDHSDPDLIPRDLIQGSGPVESNGLVGREWVSTPRHVKLARSAHSDTGMGVIYENVPCSEWGRAGVEGAVMDRMNPLRPTTATTITELT